MNTILGRTPKGCEMCNTATLVKASNTETRKNRVKRMMKGYIPPASENTENNPLSGITINNVKNNTARQLRKADPARSRAAAEAARAAPGIGKNWQEPNNNNWNNGEGNVSKNVNGSKAKAAVKDRLIEVETENNKNLWIDPKTRSVYKNSNATSDFEDALGGPNSNDENSKGKYWIHNNSVNDSVFIKEEYYNTLAKHVSPNATVPAAAAAAPPAPPAAPEAQVKKNYTFPKIEGIPTISVTNSNLNKELTSALTYKLALEQTKVKDYIKKLKHARNNTKRITKNELERLDSLEELNAKLNKKLNKGISTRKNRRSTRTSRR